MHGEVEKLSRGFAADGFWRAGWAACRQTMQFDREQLTPEAASRLSALEADLRPSNLPERVRAVVLGDRSAGLDLEDMDVDGDVTSAIERLDAIARELGAAVAADDEVFAELLPDLLRGGNRTWAFGRGLAGASRTFVLHGQSSSKDLSRSLRSSGTFRCSGASWPNSREQDRDLAQHILDSALDQPPWWCSFQCCIWPWGSMSAASSG